MSNVYIVKAKRTPIGSFLGSLQTVSAGELGAVVVKDLVSDQKFDTKAIDEVIIGHVLPAGQGQGVARQVSLKAGIDESVPAYSINMVCGSGMKSVMNGFVGIKSGLNNLVVAGGVENMSQSPHLLHSIRNGVKMGPLSSSDHMISDALTDAFDDIHMGITAENIVDKYNITRSEQDEFAIKSQEKALKAVADGVFKEEIVPVSTTVRRKEIIVDTDEYPNANTSLEKLSNLRAAFKRDGSVTAGNASGLNDGASAVLLASDKALAEFDLEPMAKVIGIGQGGVDPKVMGLGPTVAIKEALEMANLSLNDMDVIELNEAFASQSLGVIVELVEQLGGNRERIEEITNVNGGAIALGHPLGASGNRIIVSLVHEMIKQDAKYGLASLCIGGGMGTAIILERE